MHARESCARGQGYLLAKPMALAQLPAAIEAAARSPAISGQEFYPVCLAATPNDFA
jgi:hypothetical protein